MAFFKKVRSSNPLPVTTTCPVCNEEYEDEPKQLPCLHTICQDCLADCTPRGAMKMFCPIDNQELPLPMGGIAMLPTDYKVIRLLEANRGAPNATKKEKKPKRERKQERPAARPKSSTSGEESGPTLEEQEQRMKKQAAEMIDKLKKLMEEKEKELYKKIDEAIAREKRKQAGGTKDDKPPIFILDVTPSRKITQSLKESGLASIQGNRKAPTLLSDLNTAGVPSASANKPAPPPNMSYKDAAEVLRALNIPLQFKGLFNPGAVACGNDGHVAVTDYGNECVWLFGPDGAFLCQVGEDGEGSMECPDGVCFLPDNSIVVSDGPLDGGQTLQLFDISGRFVRCLVEDNDEEVSFSRITVDEKGRILVACNGGRPCVQIYKKKGKDYTLETELGLDQLQCPEKAIFHAGSFFVSDCSGKENRTVIKVFDEEGTFTESFDEDKYCLGQRDEMGIDITYPIKLAFDWSNNTFLAYHGITREVRVLRPDGSQVSSFKTVSGARDLALTKEKKVVATCGQDSILKRSVQILKLE